MLCIPVILLYFQSYKHELVPFFFLKVALAIQGFLYFHTNCEIICSRSVKNTAGSLIGIALNLYSASGSILIFTILILPIHEHGPL